MIKYFALFISFLVLASCSDERKEQLSNTTENKRLENQATPKIFELIDSSQSGITFANMLKEDVTSLENLFDFDYFYNGAGVGIADINNDGLQDIFFTGNQVPNKLYLNKGNLTFEDISDTAGINEGKYWANGVTFVDINGDGLIDIYVSQGGPKQSIERGNLLYLNLGENRFRESAKQYNLADTGISTQSVFFDYDQDGDLDCVVSNENELYGLDPERFFASMKLGDNLEKSSVQLYENVGGTFNRVTKKAGLERPAFGLGIIVSDINNDGWQDIYVSNDYYVPDVMYINNQDGTFTDKIKEFTSQVSFYGMGVDIADLNNDSLQDIFVLDMAASDHVRSKTLMASMNESRFDLLTKDLGFQHQYMFNALQLNRGGNRFDNVVQQTKMAKTDWSWAGLMADYDNDADRDVYVTNGYRKYALDNDLQNQVRETQRAFNGNVPTEIKQKLYNAMPTEKLSNIVFVNKGDLSFENQAYQWGLSVPSYSNGAAYADLDNDGDLELVVSNIDDVALVFKNRSREQSLGNYISITPKGVLSEDFAKVSISTPIGTQVEEVKRVRGYLSSVSTSVHFGIGDLEIIDKIVVQWPSGKRQELTNVRANQNIVVKEKEATGIGKPSFDGVRKENAYSFAKAETHYGLDFIHTENYFNDFAKEVLLPYKQSTMGPCITKGDVNNDGLEDVFIGGAAGQAGALYIQTLNGFERTALSIFRNDKDYEDLDAIFLDVEGDGDQDLIVVSGGNEFAVDDRLLENRLYLNNGSGVFSKGTLDNSSEYRYLYSKSVTAVDFDKDGDLDIVIGNRIKPGHFPISVSSLVYQNDQGVFTEVTKEVIPSLIDFGIINEVISTDFDNDGWDDLIAVGEWSGIGLFKNNQGSFERVDSSWGLSDERGWWFSVTETDVNNDGLKDYIVGNIGDNVKYKASIKRPFKVFASDFDDNGTFDLVLSNEYNGNYVPARGKECSTQQMPFISEKFKTYNEFANATLKDIYGDKIATAYAKEVTTFSSKLLLNTGNETFEIKELPALAQSGPGIAVLSKDINGDGYQDIIYGGAIYNTEVETPRYDGNSGVVLISNTKNGYEAVAGNISGLNLKGNVKSLQVVTHIGLSKQLLVAGVNDSSLIVVETLDQ